MDATSTPTRPPLPGANAVAGQSNGPPGPATRKRKGHRAGKKKKNRRKSFAAPPDEMAQDPHEEEGLGENGTGFYRNHNLSNTSLDSEALLDHREQTHYIRPRRGSLMTPSNPSFHSQYPLSQSASRTRTVQLADSGDEDDDADGPWNEGAPLLGTSVNRGQIFATYGTDTRRSRPHSRRDSSKSSSKRKFLNPFTASTAGNGGSSYNVNYPPSVPGTPNLRPSDPMDMSFGDVLLRDDLEGGRRSPRRINESPERHESDPPIFQPSPLDRRRTIALQAQEDVCFPQEELSEIAEDDRTQDPAAYRTRGRRRRGKWPDLGILDEWSRVEKEGRNEERRAKKIIEPQLINGRLRTVHRGLFQAAEEAPYRFTYFNEELQSTIHSQTISELVQPGGNFRELFIPDPPILSDSSDNDEDEQDPVVALHDVIGGQNGVSNATTREPSLAAPAPSTQFTDPRRDKIISPPHDGRTSAGSNKGSSQKGSKGSKQNSGDHTPASFRSPQRVKSPEHLKEAKPPRYGDRPVWWLDIMSPTEAEMKVLSKAFGIHPLTAEDIMVQEAREKVELFRHYYFVNYRSFDQDEHSENFLEPVNMYVVVFREGVLSFHFSVTPHPANVRRRIRQLSDYLILSSDWISYAIIDDITDVFGPLIHNIEDEVDEIDDAILAAHSRSDPASGDNKKRDSGRSESGETTAAESGGDMLRRVGDCRKRVMSLYRLLGNKADVIKGFAKRCNEHWEVAPRSEIGLYLGDIQDHIVTMTSNLSHYEKILARSHANYLAQINIRMNERQEQTADVLGKLTVLGTIVLPMNIITGLWGMNVWVPGQEYEGNLTWFMGITAGLIFFGVACYVIAKRVYGIV